MDEPIFQTEALGGSPELSISEDIARALRHRPLLVLLSGCRTGEAASLAQRLADRGFPKPSVATAPASPAR